MPPVYREVGREELENAMPQMSSRVLCNYFMLRLPNGIRQVLCRVHHQSDDRIPLLRFTESDGEVKVAMDGSQFSEISEEVGHHLESVADGTYEVPAI